MVPGQPVWLEWGDQGAERTVRGQIAEGPEDSGFCPESRESLRALSRRLTYTGLDFKRLSVWRKVSQG